MAILFHLSFKANYIMQNVFQNIWHPQLFKFAEQNVVLHQELKVLKIYKKGSLNHYVFKTLHLQSRRCSLDRCSRQALCWMFLFSLSSLCHYSLSTWLYDMHFKHPNIVGIPATVQPFRFSAVVLNFFILCGSELVNRTLEKQKSCLYEGGFDASEVYSSPQTCVAYRPGKQSLPKMPIASP